MAVTANPAADHSDGRVDRWQVVTLTDGLVSDIRGFEDRPSALAHASTVRADANTTDPARPLRCSTLSGALSIEIVNPPEHSARAPVNGHDVGPLPEDRSGDE